MCFAVLNLDSSKQISKDIALHKEEMGRHDHQLYVTPIPFPQIVFWCMLIIAV